jgi:hypothetical protein
MEYLGLIIAIVGSSIGLGAAVVSMFFWIRTEANADRRDGSQKLEAFRVESSQKLEAFREETRSILQAIQQEMKDFHGRLCAIEERRLKGK